MQKYTFLLISSIYAGTISISKNEPKKYNGSNVPVNVYCIEALRKKLDVIFNIIKLQF